MTTVQGLAKLRRRRALTQAALARLAGVARSTIAYLELGIGPEPSLNTVRKLAAALGVDPAEVAEFRRAIGLEESDPQ